MFNSVISYLELVTVPSFSTLHTLKRSIMESSNSSPLTPKHIVQLDWVSREDGSHILTVAVGSKVSSFIGFIYLCGGIFSSTHSTGLIINNLNAK